MLSLWRRHLDDCPFGAKGRKHTKCSCPIWCDGDVDGKRLRKSLETRDWARATRKVALIEDPSLVLILCPQPGCAAKVESGRCEQHTRSIESAVSSYHQAHGSISEETKRYRKRNLRMFEEFLRCYQIKTVDQITLDHLHAFRDSRQVSPRTWIRDLEVLRHFFRFSKKSKWLAENIAEDIPLPKNLKPAPREPYEPNEVKRMVAATEAIGRTSYERLRALALLLLLRYTALRISDVALMRKNRIRDGEIFLRTAKNGKPVKLPVHAELEAALKMLPAPRNAAEGCPYLFWSGKGSQRNAIESASRTLKAVYKKSGVAGAMSHRFRHTLATELLEHGASIEEVADILGDSEAIVRKHYVKWSAGRQARITALLHKVWHAIGTVNSAEGQLQ